MLTFGWRTGALVAAVAATFAFLVVTISSASAAGPGCPPGETQEFLGNGTYSACHAAGGTQPADPTNNGSGGGPAAPPPCDVTEFPESYHADKPGRTSNFCINTDVCYTTDVFVPIRNPYGDKPKENSKPRVTFCFVGPNASNIRDIFWSDDEKPTLLEQAQTAIGRIDLGAPTINFSPATRTLVNLDTWFWLTGAQREATGSSAFGLVAIATFQSLSVDPGDSSEPFVCKTLPTSAAEAEKSCTYEYSRASTRGSQSVDGRPAYGVTATATYSLRFEVDGTPTEVTGAPPTLTGPASTAALLVDEAQTVVRPNR